MRLCKRRLAEAHCVTSLSSAKRHRLSRNTYFAHSEKSVGVMLPVPLEPLCCLCGSHRDGQCLGKIAKAVERGGSHGTLPYGSIVDDSALMPRRIGMYIQNYICGRISPQAERIHYRSGAGFRLIRRQIRCKRNLIHSSHLPLVATAFLALPAGPNPEILGPGWTLAIDTRFIPMRACLPQFYYRTGMSQ